MQEYLSFSDMGQLLKKVRPELRTASRRDGGMPWLVTWKAPHSWQACEIDLRVELRWLVLKLKRSMAGMVAVGSVLMGRF